MTFLGWQTVRKTGSVSSQGAARRNRARHRSVARSLEQCEDRVLMAVVSLGAASTFAVLGGSTVTNTGPTTIIGDVGINPGTSITGFPPGVVTRGTINAGNALASQAQTDLATAYAVLQGETPTSNLSGTDLGGLTLTPGVYFFSSSAALTGQLTLNAQGNPNARFDFQIGTSLTTATASSIDLINGAQASNVYFQVGSSATIGTATTFEGNILANTSITVTTGATFLDGRALAINGAVTLDDNNFSVPPNGLDPGLINATAVPVTAVEGQNTGMVVLATFIDTDPSSTVHDWNTKIDWGDASPISTAIVQLAGGDPVSGGNVFAVVASHTYAEEGSPPATATITDLANPTLPPVVLPLGITVVDAPLTSSNGTVITGIEGSSTPVTAPNTVGTLLGSFTDANQGATIADYLPLPTGHGGSVVVNWGDGSALQTLAATNLTVHGSPDGVAFTINASHDYVEEGTYAYTVTVTDDGGATTVISGSAIIADAPLTAAATQPTVSTTGSPVYPVPEFGGPLFSGPVAVFTDANPLPPTGSSSIADFTATIDWGDGTVPTAGTIVQELGGSATYEVLGSHTYASTGPTGTYAIQVLIADTGGSRLTVANVASVGAVPIALTGILNPTSDSGKNNLDDITNVTRPNFYGTSQGYSNVTLYETPVGGGTTVKIGATAAGSTGAWSITSNLLAQGTYTITASATDQFGLNPTGPVTITPTLVVDTAPPVITALSFDRFDATLTVTFQSSLSGMDLASITNSAFYHISARPLVSYVHVPKLILPTSISYTPGALPTDPVVVNVVFNNGHTFRGGKYEVLINSGTGNSGIQDVAGNALSGYFYGTFPTGDGLAGGNFVAEILTFHNKVLPYIPNLAGYSPPPKGIDPPAGSSHTGRTPKTVYIKTKAPVVRTAVNQRIAAQKAKTEAFDEALVGLAAESKAKRHEK